MKNNPNIIFTRADKENITVALDRLNLNKIEQMLNDTDTYIQINRDLTKNLLMTFENCSQDEK